MRQISYILLVLVMLAGSTIQAQTNGMIEANQKLGKQMLKMQNHHQMSHDHIPVEIPVNRIVPQLELALYSDTMDGLNLQLLLRYFHMEPPEFDKAITHVVRGHAHLYINGKKIQRLYGYFTHLPASLFKSGANLVMVSLNSHDHKAWSFNNKPIFASMVINVSDDNEHLQFTLKKSLFPFPISNL